MEEYNNNNIVYILVEQRTYIGGRAGWYSDNTVELFWEVLGSNIGRDTGNHEIFVLFHSLFR
jgi:hypothetical protein